MTNDNRNQPGEPRSFETEIEIDAPIEDVWKALTDADELAKWFPPEASVEPGEGGKVLMKWSDDMKFESPIDAWEENRHLRLVYAEPTDDPNAPMPVPHRVAVDYHLESKRGKTVLRLVHSGFAADTTWDGLYDATARGWEFQLGGLKHLLERHPNASVRHTVFSRASTTRMSRNDAWRAIAGSGGVGQPRNLGDYAAGDDYRIDLGEGVVLQGAARKVDLPVEFAATITNHNDGLFRLHIDDMWGKRDVYLWVSLYDGDESTAATLRERFDHLLAELFAE